MVDYIFFDKVSTFVRVRTNAIDVNTQNLTIMEVFDQPGGIYALSAALQTAFGHNLDQLQTTKQALINVAVALSYGLGAFNVGPVAQVGTPLSTVQLAAPGSFAGATGAGAAGTLNLTWLAATNATNYVIDRAQNAGFTIGVVLGVFSGPGLAFTDSGLLPATAYFYRIRSQSQYLADSATAASGSVTSHA